MKTKSYRQYVVLLTIVIAIMGVGLFFMASTSFVRSAALSTEPHAITADDIAIDQLGPDATFVNELITYTLLVTNTSNSTLSNIIITDTWATNMSQDIQKMWPYGVSALYEGYRVLPPDAVAEEYFNVNHINMRGEATWILNPLDSGDAVQIEFIVRVPITLQPTLKSYTLLSGKSYEIGPCSIENTVIAIVQGQQYEAPLVTSQILAPLLRFTHSAWGETVGSEASRVGRFLTYTLVIENLAQDERSDSYPASNLIITDLFPEDIRTHIIASSTSVPGVSIMTNTDNALVWTFPDDFVLDMGHSTIITTWVRVPPETVYTLSGSRRLTTRRLDVLGHANNMPYRDAALSRDHIVRIWGPIEKSVVTNSPPTHNLQTYPNRVITYTITFYNPLYDTDVPTLTIGEHLHTIAGYADTLSFIAMTGGDLGNPTAPLTGSRILWEDVFVPANGVISGSFSVQVAPQAPVKSGCGAWARPNVVTATLGALHYAGPNNQNDSRISIVPQLKPLKTVRPSTQYLGDMLTFTIEIMNQGDTPINPPLLITDELPLAFEFLEMLPTGSPGEPTLITETDTMRIYQWDNVLIHPLAPGGSIEFSYRVSGEQIGSFTNVIYGYNPDTFVCTMKRKARIEIDFDVKYNKQVEPELVVQGELITYTAQVFNRSNRSPYTLTEFMDLLEHTGEDKGTRNVVDGGLWYSHTLPTPFRMDPDDQVWEHSFQARMTGYGIGHDWCKSLAIPSTSIKKQKGSDIWTYLRPLDAWAVGVGTVAPVCVLPKFSLYQQAYPNPIAVGQEFSVVLTLRDNRPNPASPLTGVILQWEVPPADVISGQDIDAFEILSSNPPPTFQMDGLYAWHNVSVPSGGATTFTLYVRAPMFEAVGWKKTYSSEFVAQVLSDHGAEVCIPSATKFVVGDGLPTSCTGTGAGVIKGLTMNQGIELDKTSSPKQVPPYGLVDYKITVRNLTGAPVSPIFITDTLPSLGEMGWQYVRMVNGPEPISTDPLVWRIDEAVPAEANIQLDFTVRAHQFLGFAYNELTCTAPIHVGLRKDFRAHTEVLIISGIGFFKVADPDFIAAGDTTTYTINLLNLSDDTLANVIVTDTLPIGFTFTHMIAPVLVPRAIGQEMVWHIPGEIKKGDTYQIVFGVETDTELFSGFYYSNLAGEAQNAGNGEPVLLPFSEGIAPVYVQGKPQVIAEKYVQPKNIMADDEVTYTLTLFNETDAPYAVIITDTLPANFTFVSSIGGTPLPVIQPGLREQLIWSGLTTMQPRETITLTFRAKADYFAVTGVYCNDVQVQMGKFVLPRRTPMQSCVSLTELPHVDVQISKDDGQRIIDAGQVLQYTITYTNSAESQAAVQTIIITDSIHPTEYVSISAPDWQLDGEHYVYQAGPLTPGESGSVTLTASLAHTIPDDVLVVENMVTIGYLAAQKTIEINPQDNQAIDRDFLQAPDLTITALQVKPAMPGLNTPLTVTVIISNQGRDPITQRWDGSHDGPLFAVELYVKPHPSLPPQDVFDHAGGGDTTEDYILWLAGQLDSGESTEAVFYLPPLTHGGQHDIYAQVDISTQCTPCSAYWGHPWGLIFEAYEDNNVSAAYFLDLPTQLYLPLIMRH